MLDYPKKISLFDNCIHPTSVDPDASRLVINLVVDDGLKDGHTY